MKPNLVALAAAVVSATVSVSAKDWPQWRGPDMNGVSTETNLPTTWSPTENIEWKIPLPMWGGSTPVIWGDRVFLQVADANGQEVSLWCIDRRTQAVIWKAPFTEEGEKLFVPAGLAHATTAVKQNENYSSPSPVTDGQMVWAMTGKGILKAFDFSGKPLWTREIQKEYGRFGLNYGYHSSPLLHDDSLYVQVVHGASTDGASYLLRIDKKTGKNIWRVERPKPASALIESADSYRTPVLLRHNGLTQIIVGGADMVTAHELATGKEIWRGTGFNPRNSNILNTVASPLVHEDIVYVPGKERLGPMIAYRAGGTGDVSETHKLWSTTSGPLTPTPVTDGQYVYSINDRGIMFCFDAKTGQEIYSQQRAALGSYASSLLLADGKLYATNEEGTTTVVRAGPKFEILAENKLDGYTVSSIAVSDGQLFIRTAEALWVVGKRVPR